MPLLSKDKSNGAFIGQLWLIAIQILSDFFWLHCMITFRLAMCSLTSDVTGSMQYDCSLSLIL